VAADADASSTLDGRHQPRVNAPAPAPIGRDTAPGPG
jgi:hypothetical protein